MISGGLVASAAGAWAVSSGFVYPADAWEWMDTDEGRTDYEEGAFLADRLEGRRIQWDINRWAATRFLPVRGGQVTPEAKGWGYSGISVCIGRQVMVHGRGYQHQTSFLLQSNVFLYHTVLILVAEIDDVIETPDQVFSGVNGC